MKSIATFTGTVEQGNQRGQSLGFPTANLSCNMHNSAIEEGIYAAFVHRNGKKLPSIAFLGAAQTFGETEKKLEVYILDFSEDIYGEKLAVTLLKKLRDNKRFTTKQELIAHMQQDEKAARSFFLFH